MRIPKVECYHQNTFVSNAETEIFSCKEENLNSESSTESEMPQTKHDVSVTFESL